MEQEQRQLREGQIITTDQGAQYWICPNCGSDDIECYDSYPEDDWYQERATCRNCSMSMTFWKRMEFREIEINELPDDMRNNEDDEPQQQSNADHSLERMVQKLWIEEAKGLSYEELKAKIIERNHPDTLKRVFEYLAQVSPYITNEQYKKLKHDLFTDEYVDSWGNIMEGKFKSDLCRLGNCMFDYATGRLKPIPIQNAIDDIYN